MKLLFIDTETTALVKNSAMPLQKQPFILELFMLLWDQESDSEEVWQSLFKPPIPIPPEVTRITGLKEEDLAGAPVFRHHLDAVQKFISASDVVVAHNASYDKFVMECAFRREDTPIVWPPRTICTVESTEHLKGHRLNLTALHTLLFGEAFDAAHRAESDVRATLACFKKLIEMGEM
jgi:DNA polymerase III epsilon subunit-like protein